MTALSPTAPEDDGFLKEAWYAALPSSALKAGKTIGKILLGEPVLLGRANNGAIFALRDVCPHRGVPLSCGHFDGETVECPYHGWSFDAQGRCSAIPSLVEGQSPDLIDRIKVKSYPARESGGLIWVYFGASDGVLPEPPCVSAIADRYQFHLSMIFPCSVDHAVIGLMDPAHGPYVHKSLLWRSKKESYEKAKHFSPAPLGWVMDRHAPSRNARAYKILGGAITTEISFRLPGIRIEHAIAGRYAFCGLTACTPIDAKTTEVHHVIYCDMPWFAPLRPLLKRIASRFLGQDRDIVAKQALGLAFDPTLMLINDADVLAKWYFRLKKEYIEAKSQNRPFVNPLKPALLRWRS